MAEPALGQGPENHPRSPTQVMGSQVPEPSPAVSQQVQGQEAGIRIRAGTPTLALWKGCGFTNTVPHAHAFSRSSLKTEGLASVYKDFEFGSLWALLVEFSWS